MTLSNRELVLSIKALDFISADMQLEIQNLAEAIVAENCASLLLMRTESHSNFFGYLMYSGDPELAQATLLLIQEGHLLTQLWREEEYDIDIFLSMNCKPLIGLLSETDISTEIFSKRCFALYYFFQKVLEIAKSMVEYEDIEESSLYTFKLYFCNLISEIDTHAESMVSHLEKLKNSLEFDMDIFSEFSDHILSVIAKREAGNLIQKADYLEGEINQGFTQGIY